MLSCSAIATLSTTSNLSPPAKPSLSPCLPSSLYFSSISPPLHLSSHHARGHASIKAKPLRKTLKIVSSGEPLRVMISGAPASGKGTQCEMIAQKFGVVHISTGDILRAEVSAGTEIGNKAKEYMNSGRLVPDEIVTAMVTTRLSLKDVKEKGWLLDGYPRSSAQAESLEKLNIRPDVYFMLEVPDDVLIDRCVGRRLDPLTGKIYHVKNFPPENEEIKDRLVTRPDDTEEKVKSRLEIYKKNVESILSTYSDVMFKINGNRAKEVVFEEIDYLLLRLQKDKEEKSKSGELIRNENQVYKLSSEKNNWRGIPTRLNNIPHSREIREYFYEDVLQATKRAIENGKTRLKERNHQPYRMTIDKGKKKCLPVRTPTPKKICREEASNANTDDDFVDEHPVLCGKTLAVIDIPEGSKRKGNNSSKRDKCQSVRVARSASNKDEKSKEKEKRKKVKNPKGVQCKRRRVRKKEETGDESSQKDEKYPKLNTRSTPAAFFKKLRDLNEAQREAVHAIGFGRILEFTIKDVPSRLAYWVLDKYNSRTGCLEIDGTCKIQIYEDDVYRVFGFPKGEKKIEVFERTEVNELFSEWMDFFTGRSREKIKIKSVLEKMIDCVDGGTWFKRHFMIAMSFSLMVSCTSGTVHPYILNCLENVYELGTWNWGEYIIRTLIDHKRSWVNNKAKVFAGPVLFLMLFYVDRVEIHRQTNTRKFPVFVNWTSPKLRERQMIEKDDKFVGGGCLRDPIELPAEYSIVRDQNEENNVEADVNETELGTEEVAKHFMNESIQIAERIQKLRAIVRKLPEAERHSKVLRDTINAGCLIMGIKFEDKKQDQKDDCNTIEIDDDPFFSSEEVLAAVDAATAKALGEKTNEICQTNDIPSFSLNMTQEFAAATNEQPNTDIAAEKNVGGDTARDGGVTHTNHGYITQADDDVGMYFATESSIEMTFAEWTDIGHKEAQAGVTAASVHTDQPVFELPTENAKHAPTEQDKNTQLGVDEEKAPVDNNINEDAGMNEAVKEAQVDEPPAKTEVRRSKRVRGSVVMRAGKEIMNATKTASEVLGKGKTKCGVDRIALKPIDSNIDEEVERMEKTPKTGKLLRTIKFRSPYFQREICTVKPLKKAEKEIGVYSMYLESGEIDEILMSYMDIQVTRHDMLSMKRGNKVGIPVMDAWSAFLNDREKYRSNSSPLRFFATTSFFVENIAPSDWTYEDQMGSFYRSLMYELNEFGKNPVDLIDLFFFPVYENQQYYALCVDTRRDRLYILDSSIDLAADTNYDKYTNVCTKIQSLLSDYLYSKNEEAKANSVKNSILHVVRMKWADHNNLIDTGVYLMRHMETFMGDTSSNWKCNISSTRSRQISRMRIRYCYSIISWEHNEVKDDIMRDASNQYPDICVGEGANIDLMLLG